MPNVGEAEPELLELTEVGNKLDSSKRFKNSFMPAYSLPSKSDEKVVGSM